MQQRTLKMSQEKVINIQRIIIIKEIANWYNQPYKNSSLSSFFEPNLVPEDSSMFNLQATKLFIVTPATKGRVVTPLDFVLGSRYCIV